MKHGDPFRSTAVLVTVSRSTLVLAALGLMTTANRADAVIVAGSAVTFNTSAPPPEPGLGWDNVGVLNVGSGVYLGNGWVLTANHVGGGSIALDSGTYAMEANSGRRLMYPAVGSQVTTDLYLFRLATDPGLPWVTLAAQTDPGDLVIMIGNGLTRGAAIGTTGYALNASKTMAWGLNTIDSKVDFGVAGSSDYVKGYSTLFAPGGSARSWSESGQATVGDSGGAVFRLNLANSWDLAGIIIGRNGVSDGPVTFGTSRTYIADLPAYRDQIVQITAVPEPAAGLLAAIGLLAAAGAKAGRWRRRWGEARRPKAVMHG